MKSGGRPKRRASAAAIAGTDLAAALAEAGGLINTTPIGMEKYPGMPVPAELLQPALWVAESSISRCRPSSCPMRGIGCATLDGGGMAVFQAVEAFRLITGIEPDAERMLRHFASMGRSRCGSR